MVAKTYSQILQDHQGDGYSLSFWSLFGGVLSRADRFLRVDTLLGLKKRHIFTKNKRLRLRYTVALSAGLALAGFAIFPVDALDSKASTFVTERVSGADGVQDLKVEASYSPAQDLVSQTMKKAVVLIKKPEPPLDHHIKISSGGTIAGALQDLGVESQDAYFAVKALKQYFDPRRVKAGQEIDVRMKRDKSGTVVFDEMVLKVDPVKSVSVTKKDQEFKSALQEKELRIQNFAKSAEIQTSLYGSAARAGIPPQVIAELIRAYSWDVDFQRDIRQGDKIEVLYSIQETEDGEFAGYGDISYASLSVGGREKPIYRYETKDGRTDYFGPDGQSVKKTLMKTPIDGARLSSGFGMRKHPVLGYNKMHKGIDFAAAVGTPIYAAGDAVVEYAGRNGSFGNYVRLRHNGTLKTAYAHMLKLGPKIGVGKRVEQGQVIGYVGTTGRSTGPHLHYEVLVNDAQVNPNRVDLPVGETLKGTELARFKSLVGAVRQEYASLSGNVKLADNSVSSDHPAAN